MKIYFFTLLILIITSKAHAQNCDCKELYQWTKHTFEENDVGNSYIEENNGLQVYELHNQLTTSKIKKIKDPIACEAAIKDWLSFFRNAHVDFRYTQNKISQHTKKTLAVDSFSMNNNALYRQFIL